MNNDVRIGACHTLESYMCQVWQCYWTSNAAGNNSNYTLLAWFLPPIAHLSMIFISDLTCTVCDAGHIKNLLAWPNKVFLVKIMTATQNLVWIVRLHLSAAVILVTWYTKCQTGRGWGFQSSIKMSLDILNSIYYITTPKTIIMSIYLPGILGNPWRKHEAYTQIKSRKLQWYSVKIRVCNVCITFVKWPAKRIFFYRVCSVVCLP